MWNFRSNLWEWALRHLMHSWRGLENTYKIDKRQEFGFSFYKSHGSYKLTSSCHNHLTMANNFNYKFITSVDHDRVVKFAQEAFLKVNSSQLLTIPQIHDVLLSSPGWTALQFDELGSVTRSRLCNSTRHPTRKFCNGSGFFQGQQNHRSLRAQGVQKGRRKWLQSS